MELGIKNKFALVCASSKGLGFSVVESLLEEGCDVLMTSRNLEKLNTEVVNEKLFPEGVNVEIYQIVSRNYIKASVFERGVGETDACGSGALCIFNYLNKTDRIDNNSYVMYPGGDLNLRFENNNLYLLGEVRYL